MTELMSLKKETRDYIIENELIFDEIINTLGEILGKPNMTRKKVREIYDMLKHHTGLKKRLETIHSDLSKQILYEYVRKVREHNTL